jgi:hypothetical protein
MLPRGSDMLPTHQPALKLLVPQVLCGDCARRLFVLPALVFLHYWGGTGRTWDLVIAS